MFHGVRRKDNLDGWFVLTLDAMDGEDAKRLVWQNFDKVSSYNCATTVEGVKKTTGRVM
jgi:hypothetical protein